MANRLASVQIGLGCLIVLFSLVSVTTARWKDLPRQEPTYGPDGIPIVIIYTPPPQSPGFAWATAIAGLAVVVCGVFQQKMATKYSGGQIFMGTISALASAILGLAISNQPWISGNIYYLSVVTLVSGVIVVVLGFLQSGLWNSSRYESHK
jgi:hypothetical protein